MEKAIRFKVCQTIKKRKKIEKEIFIIFCRKNVDDQNVTFVIVSCKGLCGAMFASESKDLILKANEICMNISFKDM